MAMNEESLFAAALQKASAAELQAYLDEACAGDAALRQRVERLLAADRRSGGILERGPDALAINPPLAGPPLAAEHVFAGRFKLRQKLGEGGMGEVWVADQTEPVQRRVALKVVRPGLDSTRMLARFEQERQALALMDHPNIARVLDAGMDEAGRPYFAMELIKGVPITDYCDDARLSPRQRLALFIPVCQAVQHAHQKGIIHRDLKPSNILVAPYDGVPVPKVIDFGLAKATGPRLVEHSVYTEIGSFLGTLEYMSPEQAELNNLDVDTRSDIYSLGVVLYELLTGSVPFSRRELQEVPFTEMLRMIRETDPPRPSTRLSGSGTLPRVAAVRRLESRKLIALLRGELDWIVMKALEKDRSRRYETASSLAADVQRYLADEPVLACPPSAGYRLRKFVRRNKGPVLAAGLVALALVGGIAGMALGLIEAHRQYEAAQAAAEVERQAKETALAREAETRSVLEFIESKIIAAARPKGQDGGLGGDVTLRRTLEAALPFVDQGFPGQPLIEARLRLTLARSFGNLGEPRIATAQAEKARAIYRKHLGPDHPDTLKSMHSLASCYEGLGRHADAIKLLQETLALMKAKLGPDDLRTLMAMNNLANNYAALGRHAEALKLHEESLALRKAKFGPEHPTTLASMNNLALTYSALGRHAEALKLGQKTLALVKATFGPDHPNTLRSMDSLACIYHGRGQYGEAVRVYEETLALMKATFGPDHPTTVGTMNDLARSYVALGRSADALTLYEQTLALRKARPGLDHPDTQASMNSLARLLATSSDPKVRNASRAVELARQAVELAPKVGHYWNTLGVAHYRGGDRQAAVAALEKSMKLRQGGDCSDWFFLAMAHWQLGDKEEARTWYGRAAQWMDKNQPKNEELRRFRAEAAELLELKEKK
jgi:serine/threonine protein kinase/tetratricopeptide (TPR) repeat protein